MSDELQKFFSLRSRYQASNILAKSFLLDEQFEQLADETSSPSLKKTIRSFIESEKAERKRRHREAMERYRAEREEYIANRMVVMDRWEQGQVQRSTAKDLIEASAWWLTHSSGNPVRAPRHADRIADLRWGWSIEFGANHFLISKFVRDSAPFLIEGFELAKANQFPNKNYFKKNIKKIASQCVSNYNYDLYDTYQPVRGQLVFGAQAIDVNDVAECILTASGLSRYFMASGS